MLRIHADSERTRLHRHSAGCCREFHGAAPARGLFAAAPCVLAFAARLRPLPPAPATPAAGTFAGMRGNSRLWSEASEYVIR